MISDDDFYYMGGLDDFDVFDDKEELPGVNESEPEAIFDDWEEEIPLDSSLRMS